MAGIDIMVKSRYLCGADGANSTIVKELGLPMHAEPFQGLALNVYVEADMVRPRYLVLTTIPASPLKTT